MKGPGFRERLFLSPARYFTSRAQSVARGRELGKRSWLEGADAFSDPGKKTELEPIFWFKKTEFLGSHQKTGKKGATELRDLVAFTPFLVCVYTIHIGPRFSSRKGDAEPF